MKKFWLSVLGTVVMIDALFGFVACGGEKISVAFESEEIVMKVGDEKELVVIVTGSDDTATLTSADPDVVSVEGYKLIAKSAGTAEIIAKVGSASAVCKVTVTEDATIGVITLNYEKAELLKGGKITLEANLSYNAQPVTGASFEWTENSNGAVVSIAANGNTATVTAVEFGTAKVTVKTSYRNKKIAAEAEIRVKDDISLEINNLTRENGAYGIKLTNNPQDEGNISQFTPSVTVKKNGAEVADAQVSARVKTGSAEDVIALDGLKITALKQGAATVELVYVSGSDEYVQEIAVTVVVPVVKADGWLYLEKSVGFKALSVADLGTVSSVKLGDKALAFTQKDGVVTISDFAEEDFGEGTLEVSADNMIWRTNGFVCTKAIGTADEWNAVAATISENKLDGYYVLSADLDYAGKPAPKFCTPTWGGTQGFAGTFDGRGHLIKNLTISVADGETADGQSFFGLTSATAVIRNVGFINAKIDSTANFRAAVVAGFLYGKAENVFMQVTNDSAHSGAIAQSVWSGAVVRNCVVEQLNERENSYALCWTSFDGSTIENSYSVGADVLYRNGGDSPANAPETATLKSFASFAEMKAAELDLSGFNGALWDTEGGVPVVKGYKEMISVDGAILNDNALPVTDSLTIQSTGGFVYTLKEEIDGITIEGTVVTVVGNAGATFTVVATHALYSDITTEKTFTVASLPVVELDDAEVDLSVGTLVLTVEGTVSKVFAGDAEAEFSQAETALTIRGITGTAGSETEITVTTDVSIYKLSVFCITKVISSAEEWNAVAATISENKLDGYYVLSADLDFTGKPAPKFCTPTWGGTQGFAGTFDGRGHVIKNFTASTANGEETEGGYSFFGLTAGSAVIRNVGFVNAKIDSTANFRTGVVASFHYGTIENVFVQVTNPSDHSGAIAHSVWGTIRNCVAEQLNERTGSYGLCWTSFDGSTIENSYSVGADVLYRNGGNSPANAPETATLKSFASFAEMKAAELDLSGFNGALWDTENGVPVVKGYKDTVSADDAILNDNVQPVMGTLEIVGAKNFVYTLKEEIDGITINGATVTVTGNFGATFTVVATHELYSDITAEKTFTVANRSTVDLGSRDIDLSAGTLILKDFSGTVEGVTVGGSEAAFTQEGRTLTVTGLTGTAGKTLAVVITTEEKYCTLNALCVTKIIASADDWNAVAATISENKLDGYYVLSADLDFTGKTAPTLCGEQWGGESGFIGTFDGRGYAIKGLSYSSEEPLSSCGFFGTVGRIGVIKNLAFIDCEIALLYNKGGVLANLVYGTIENVYMSVKNNGHWWTGGLCYYVLGGATARNCVIEITEGVDAEFKAALANSIKTDANISDCYAIGVQPLTYVDDAHGSFEETDTLKSFASFAEMETAELDLSGWNTEIWNTEGGVPVFRGNNG